MNSIFSIVRRSFCACLWRNRLESSHRHQLWLPPISSSFSLLFDEPREEDSGFPQNVALLEILICMTFQRAWTGSCPSEDTLIHFSSRLRKTAEWSHYHKTYWNVLCKINLKSGRSSRFFFPLHTAIDIAVTWSITEILIFKKGKKERMNEVKYDIRVIYDQVNYRFYPANIDNKTLCLRANSAFWINSLFLKSYTIRRSCFGFKETKLRVSIAILFDQAWGRFKGVFFVFFFLALAYF